MKVLEMQLKKQFTQTSLFFVFLNEILARHGESDQVKT